MPCQTCYTHLPSPLPSDAFTPACCNAPICGRCIAKNPRLRLYVPCLRCGAANGNLRGGEGGPSLIPGRAGGDVEEVMFTLGEDEDELDDADDQDAVSLDKPPSYTSITDAATAAHAPGSDRQPYTAPPAPHTSQTPSGTLVPAQASSSSRANSSSGSKRNDIIPAIHATESQANDEELEVVEVRHPISRTDTLLGIARKYAADPHELLALNSMPPSVLSTQPHLLRTRKTLLISRRSVPRSRLPDPTLFEADIGDVSAEEETAARRKEREIKRFQLITKTEDPSIGRTYHALTEGGAVADASREKEKEEPTDGRQPSKGQKAGYREGRMLEQYMDDMDWELAMGGPATYKKGQAGKYSIMGMSGAAAAGPSVTRGVGEPKQKDWEHEKWTEGLALAGTPW